MARRNPMVPDIRPMIPALSAARAAVRFYGLLSAALYARLESRYLAVSESLSTTGSKTVGFFRSAPPYRAGMEVSGDAL